MALNLVEPFDKVPAQPCVFAGILPDLAVIFVVFLWQILTDAYRLLPDRVLLFQILIVWFLSLYVVFKFQD
jgi:hypothetical protein